MAEIKYRQTDRQTDKSVRQQTDCQVVVLGQMDNTIDHTFESANRVYDKNQLCPTIPTCAGGGIQPKVIEDTRCVGGLSDTPRGRVQEGGDVTPTLTASNSENINYVESRYRIRKLTPKECWRLMGYTDEDFENAEKVNSNTQLYKEAGNAIVKQVLMAIFSQMGIKNVPKWNETKEVIE